MTARAFTSATDVLELAGIDPVRSVDDAAAHEWERARVELERRSFIALSGLPVRLVRRWERDECPELVARVLAGLRESDLVILEPRVDRVAAAGALLERHDAALGSGRPTGGLWCSAREHVDLVMAGRRSDAHVERAQARRAQIASLLVIDRVGGEHDKTSAIVDRLLADRWDATLKTVVCSWVPTEQWQARYPEIVAASSGQARVIRCS